MIVKINGMFWYDMNEKTVSGSEADEIIVPSFRKSINPKTKLIATALWTMSASFVTDSASASSFYERMQPLNIVFQDLALGLGSLALLTGFILLVVKKKWGVMTLKMTGIIVVGVFLAPSALMLLAIIGTEMGDALWDALNDIREVKAVSGQ
jgi:hypothetical protein